MNKKIVLNKEQTIRLGTEPFIVGMEEDLTIEVLSNYDLSDANITLQNGKVNKTYKLTKSFTIPKELMFAGKLGGTITQYIGSQLTKKWHISPLILKEVENGVEMLDQMEEFNERLTKLEKQNEILK